MSVSNVYKVAGIEAFAYYSPMGWLTRAMVVTLSRRGQTGALPWHMRVDPERIAVRKLVGFRRYARRMARKQGLR